MIWVAVTFFGLLAIGMPVGFVLGVAGMVGIMDMGGGKFLSMAPDRMFAGLDLFPFLAMPFFILAGEIMNRSGITNNLVKFADALVGWMRGGMAHSNMVASGDVCRSYRRGKQRTLPLSAIRWYPPWSSRAIPSLLPALLPLPDRSSGRPFRPRRWR